MWISPFQTSSVNFLEHFIDHARLKIRIFLNNANLNLVRSFLVSLYSRKFIKNV